MADFYFSTVALRPNPVNTSEEFEILVEMKDKEIVLEDGSGAVLIDGSDGAAILVKRDDVNYTVLENGEGNVIIDADGSALQIRKE